MLTFSCRDGSEKLKSTDRFIPDITDAGEEVADGAGAGGVAAGVTRAEEVEEVVAVTVGAVDADVTDALGVARAERSEVLEETVLAIAPGVAEVVVGEDSVAETAAASCSFLFLC